MVAWLRDILRARNVKQRTCRILIKYNDCVNTCVTKCAEKKKHRADAAAPNVAPVQRKSAADVAAMPQRIARVAVRKSSPPMRWSHSTGLQGYKIKKAAIWAILTNASFMSDILARNNKLALL